MKMVNVIRLKKPYARTAEAYAEERKPRSPSPPPPTHTHTPFLGKIL